MNIQNPKRGELTYTKEETDLSLITLSAGMRYRIITGRVNLYTGLGMDYIFY